MVSLDIWEGNILSYSFNQVCLGYIWPFALPYKFYNQFAKFHEIMKYWNFDLVVKKVTNSFRNNLIEL